jgi:hypothetical protein
MNKKNFTYNDFYSVFVDFIDDLYETYDDMSLGMLKIYLKNCNKKYIFELFMKHVKPYESVILNRDESFITQGKLLEEYQDKTYIHTELHKVIDIWKNPNTSKNTKECIWEYFVCLLKIGNNIITNTNTNVI